MEFEVGTLVVVLSASRYLFDFVLKKKEQIEKKKKEGKRKKKNR